MPRTQVPPRVLRKSAASPREVLKRLIESKRAHRVKLAALPFEEKVRMLAKLRLRTAAIRTARRPVL